VPERIRRQRHRGWRLPVGAVIVDRTTVFGNPFRVTDELDAAAAVAKHRAWLACTPGYEDTYTVGRRTFDRRVALARLAELRGRCVACPCPIGDPCHGDTLIVLANQ
jgi:hypothetical protein